MCAGDYPEDEKNREFYFLPLVTKGVTTLNLLINLKANSKDFASREAMGRGPGILVEKIQEY